MARTDPPVKSLKTSLDILEALRTGEGMGVAELAAELDRPSSTVHDHLQTLEAEEYLIKEDGTYRIGIRFLELGEQARSRMKVYNIARPEIDNLAAETGEHANLMIEEHGRGVFLYKARGENAVKLDTHAGMRVPLQTTSLGKTILANRPRSDVEAILDQHGLPQVTENTIADRDELFDELDRVRERGYAYDDEERVEGMRCVATSVTDSSGDPIAAVSVSGPKSRLQGDRYEEEVPDAVLQSANVIEVNLTYA